MRKCLVGIVVVVACLTVLVPGLAKADTTYVANAFVSYVGPGLSPYVTLNTNKPESNVLAGPYKLNVNGVNSLWDCTAGSTNLVSPWYAYETNLAGAITAFDAYYDPILLVSHSMDAKLNEVAWLADQVNIPANQNAKTQALYNEAIWYVMDGTNIADNTTDSAGNTPDEVKALANSYAGQTPGGYETFLIPLTNVVNGYGTFNPNNQPMVTTPEPGAFLVFGSALGWLGFALRRRLNS